MRLILSRCGGFAGISRPPITVDTGDLAPEEAALMAKLLSGARFFELSSEQSGPGQPDRFEYTIEVIPDSGSPHVVTISENDAPEPLLELVRMVQRIGKQKRRSRDQTSPL